MKTPAPKQAETLGHIREFIEANGYPPTVAELAAKAGVVATAMQERLNALERKGCISRQAKTARSIRLL